MSGVKREPKGTSTGGRFAPDVNAESTIDLPDDFLDSGVDAASQFSGLELSRMASSHEPPFQIGSVLEYDVEVVPWVPGMHEDNVAVQVWTKEFGNEDNDCAGWEPRAIAQIARERGIANVTFRDLQDILDDPDNDRIAFRPDTSIATLIEQINQCNSDHAVPELRQPATSPHKQRYIDNIHAYLDDNDMYDPNDAGVALIEESSMKIIGELETRNGVAWNGELTIGDEILYVSNDGNGGSNFYQIKEGGWPRIGEINDRVSAGFPGLAGPEALDSFCLVAEVAQLDQPRDET